MREEGSQKKKPITHTRREEEKYVLRTVVVVESCDYKSHTNGYARAFTYCNIVGNRFAG